MIIHTVGWLFGRLEFNGTFSTGLPIRFLPAIAKATTLHYCYCVAEEVTVL